MDAAGSGRGRTGVPALTTWRRADPGRLGPAALARVRVALAGSPLLHHRRWPEALRGDAAAAIAVAIDCLPRGQPCSLATDVAMSRLLLHAAARDPAAILVLDHAAGRLDRPSDGRPLPTGSQRRSRRSRSPRRCPT